MPQKLPRLFPEGSILSDTLPGGGTWFLGPHLAKGGCGRVYLASNIQANALDKATADYVVKIEEKGSSSLFCEFHFYKRCAEEQMLNDWMKERQLKHLGIPRFVASGTHVLDEVEYRFLVIPRYSEDLHSTLQKQGKRLTRIQVCQIAIELSYILEYMHFKNYAHSDIKSSNIVLAPQESGISLVYLIDYGIAVKMRQLNYREDPKIKNYGTLEYTSRDAHHGAPPSRRGDLEILAYNLVKWSAGFLPWDTRLRDKEAVISQKVSFMSDLGRFMSTVYPDRPAPPEIRAMLKYVNGLKYSQLPDYELVRKFFVETLHALGCKMINAICMQPTFSVKASPSYIKVKRTSKPGLQGPCSSKAQPVCAQRVGVGNLSVNGSKVSFSSAKKHPAPSTSRLSSRAKSKNLTSASNRPASKKSKKL